MNRSVQLVLLGIGLSAIFLLLGDGITHAIGKTTINGYIIILPSIFLGFLIAAIVRSPTRQK